MECQCQAIEEVFSQEYATKELSSYRAKGPGKTTRMLIEAIKEAIQLVGAEGGLSLLDIGGGVGAVQHALLEDGVAHATDVDASQAYIALAREEAQRRGHADRVRYLHGNFVELAEDLAPADIVTLDRVICCYPDMDRMVGLSARRARKIYGLVYPRDTWWVKIGNMLENFSYRLRGNPFRAFTHPTRAVEAILESNGFRRCFYRRTLLWQVAVYTH